MVEKIHHFIVNAICGLVYGRDRRRHVRTVLNGHPIRNLRFVQKHLGTRLFHTRIRTGYMGRNIVIITNDKWAFKFPVASENAYQKALREKRVVDALREHCPVRVPNMELIPMQTATGEVMVRKYEIVHGTTVREMPAKQVLNNIHKLAPQMAAAIYAIGCANPTEIRDLKTIKNAQPRYMHGWCQGDICDNFMIDPTTMRITAYIDWEDASFMDFSNLFESYQETPARELMTAVAREYDKLWRRAHPAK